MSDAYRALRLNLTTGVMDAAVTAAITAATAAKAAIIQAGDASTRKDAATYAGLGITPFVGMKVLEAGVKEVTEITCLGSAAGVAEITNITCLGSVYAAAVAGVTEIICGADSGGSLNGLDFYLYRQSDGLPVLVWLNVDSGGTVPDWGVEGVDVHYIAVPIAAGAAATVVAEAVKVAMEADAAFTATRSGGTVTVTQGTAGFVAGGGDDSSGFTVNTVTDGAGAAHVLEGESLTLRVPGATLTVGYSEAGNVGTIPVTLPAATTQTANEIAALTKVAVDNHAALIATVVGAVVTVTNVTQGAVTHAGAGGTGFGISVTTQGTNHALEGKLLTLQALNRIVTVGYSLAGTVGDIPITLPATTRTAEQIAALTQTAVEAHASFGAAVSGAVVTVTNTLAAAVSGSIAGTTGFGFAVLTAGVTGSGNLFLLLATAELATDTGWLAVPALENSIGPAFSAYYGGSNFALLWGIFTKVVMATETFDTHGCYDPATGRFTPTKAGKYLINVSGRVALITGSVSVTVFKNGADIGHRAGEVAVTNGSNAVRSGGAKIVQANGTTDYFEFHVRQMDTDGSSARHFRGGGDGENVFQACYLQP